MTDETPIFETLEPPPGGLVGLRQKLEPRGRGAWPIKALSLACAATALVALFVVPAHRPPRTLVIQYTPSVAQSVELDGQIALLDFDDQTSSTETVSVRAGQASTTQVTPVFESSKTSFYLVAALSWP